MTTKEQCLISQDEIHGIATGENSIKGLENLVVENPGCGTAVIEEARDVGFTPEAQGQLEKGIKNLNNSPRRNLVEIGKSLFELVKGLFLRV